MESLCFGPTLPTLPTCEVFRGSSLLKPAMWFVILCQCFRRCTSIYSLVKSLILGRRWSFVKNIGGQLPRITPLSQESKPKFNFRSSQLESWQIPQCLSRAIGYLARCRQNRNARSKPRCRYFPRKTGPRWERRVAALKSAPKNMQPCTSRGIRLKTKRNDSS